MVSIKMQDRIIGYGRHMFLEMWRLHVILHSPISQRIEDKWSKPILRLNAPLFRKKTKDKRQWNYRRQPVKMHHTAVIHWCSFVSMQKQSAPNPGRTKQVNACIIFFDERTSFESIG
jgi:hypothetical protein